MRGGPAEASVGCAGRRRPDPGGDRRFGRQSRRRGERTDGSQRSSAEALLRAALRDARLSPDEVEFIETHGTGTSLGDPIEVQALGRVFCEADRSRPLVLGAVKSNFGHLEAAAGIIGLIKVVQCLRHETIPANLHLQTPTPLIAWSQLAVELPRQNRAWSRGGRRRVAGVSSFGISGTNAHVVVCEAPVAERADSRHASGERIC